MPSNFTQTISTSSSSLVEKKSSSSLQSRVFECSLPSFEVSSLSSFLPTSTHNYFPSSSRSSFVLSSLDSLYSLEMFSKSHLEIMHSRVFDDSLPLMILMEWSSIYFFSSLL
jgi:hypothetical protein